MSQLQERVNGVKLDACRIYGISLAQLTSVHVGRNSLIYSAKRYCACALYHYYPFMHPALSSRELNITPATVIRWVNQEHSYSYPILVNGFAWIKKNAV